MPHNPPPSIRVVPISVPLQLRLTDGGTVAAVAMAYDGNSMYYLIAGAGVELKLEWVSDNEVETGTVTV